MTKLYFVFSVLFIICRVDAFLNAPETRLSRTLLIAQGPVKGYRDPAGLYAFYDIPYATAPTGRNRFKAPLPPPTWMRTFEAVDKVITCPQPYRPPDLGTKSEDCLVASVFVSDTNRTNLPVYVMIHGGAYQFGFGNINTVKELVRSKEMVAVTFNYRLGVHGFLCLGTEMVPGNAGMKDQVAALRWIKENIARFGGNPDDITLSGTSAGASSAELLMLSKSAEGLFNKVIVQSGAAVAEWSADPEPVERAKRYARKLNFTASSIKALEYFYTTTPLHVLMSVESLDTMKHETLFWPCVERHMGEETFIEKAPVDIMKSGDYPKIPMLYGFCNKEGIFKVDDFEEDSKNMNMYPTYHLPLDLQFEMLDEEESVAKRTKELYFGNRTIGIETVEGYIDMQSDILFIFPMLRSVKLHIEAGHDQIYLYQFSYPTEHVLFGNITSVGATHSAQAIAVFDESEDDMTIDYRQMKKIMRDLWYGFIATGNPVSPTSRFPPWPPVSSTKRFPYMMLDTTLSLQYDLLNLTDRIQLWDEIYDKHYRTPSPPGL